MTEWDITERGIAHKLAVTLDGLQLTGPAGRIMPWSGIASISFPTAYSARIANADNRGAIDIGFRSAPEQRMFQEVLDTLLARAEAGGLTPQTAHIRDSRVEVSETDPRRRPSPDLRERLRGAVIANIEAHEVSGESLPFNRDVGRQWFHDTEGEPVFKFLKARLEGSLRELMRTGPTRQALQTHATALRLDCLDNMHASSLPGAIFEEEFRLSAWYQSVKRVTDPDDDLSDREFAEMNVHLLLQEACYMLELPGFLAIDPETTPPLEARLAAAEASNRRLRLVGVAALMTVIVLVVAGVGTARHWTKIDVPAQPETFRTQTYKTGSFVVKDDGRSPCTVGQAWSGCISEMSTEYSAACGGPPPGDPYFSDIIISSLRKLTAKSEQVCDAYAREIVRMQQQADATYVATVGGFGRLTRTPQRATRKVSNNDRRPAVTHEAVCYLGFIGDCE